MISLTFSSGQTDILRYGFLRPLGRWSSKVVLSTIRAQCIAHVNWDPNTQVSSIINLFERNPLSFTGTVTTMTARLESSCGGLSGAGVYSSDKLFDDAGLSSKRGTLPSSAEFMVVAIAPLAAVFVISSQIRQVCPSWTYSNVKFRGCS